MKKKIVFASVAIVVVVVIVVVVFTIKPKSAGSDNIIKENNILEDKGSLRSIQEFNIKAFRFGYEPDIIRVKKGDKVKIVIDNSDTDHGIRIPDLEIQGMDSIEFTADKTGEFTWYCNNYCGSGHRSMQGKIVVE
jgi:cytochrome c oxidase subunit 2